MTIRLKLMLTFSALALFVVIVAGLAIVSLFELNARFTRYVEGVDARGKVLGELRRAADDRAIGVRNLVLLTDSSQTANEQSRVVEAHERVGRSLDELRRRLQGAPMVSEVDRKMFADIEKTERAYSTVALAIVQLANQGKRDEAIAKMNNDCRPLLAQLSDISDKYFDFVRNESTRIAGEGASTFAARRNLLVAASLLAVAFACAAGVAMTRGIVRPIESAVQLAERVAQGDLTARVEASGRDEISMLLAALARMSKNLSEIVERVRMSSDSIATGSAEIAAGNADLSQRTEQQASSLQITAATMDQLGGNVRSNAQHAMQANQLAAGASTVAEEGGVMVNQVVDTMRGINDSSRKIGDIISVIDGIAFQTNILALNAAVEAARAGEQGRGFAVVASEVRSLAQRSAAAAKEISHLIGTSVQQVERGCVQVGVAGKKMEDIVGSIKRVTTIVGEITQASIEQSEGIQQVGAAVTQMDTVTQQNAALVEESAAAAESLRTQADHLVSAVSVFKLLPER